jgi:predicted HD phosphohydrolase
VNPPAHLFQSPHDYLQELWQLLPRMRELPFPAPVDQLEHSVQCASRAWRDGASPEWVLCALFHDIGRLFETEDHATASAQALQPLLSPETLWVLANHDVFMLRYAPPEAEVDHEMRRRFDGHPWYARAAYFADNWDCRSFDPQYPSLPIEFFEPILFEYALRLKGSEIPFTPPRVNLNDYTNHQTNEH